MSYNISTTNYMALPGLMPGVVMYANKNAEKIIYIVCEALEVTRKDLLSKDRYRGIVQARQMAMFLIRKHTGKSLRETGRIFGGRDHTTAIHSINTVKNLCFADENYRSRLLNIENQL